MGTARSYLSGQIYLNYLNDLKYLNDLNDLNDWNDLVTISISRGRVKRSQIFCMIQQRFPVGWIWTGYSGIRTGPAQSLKTGGF